MKWTVPWQSPAILLVRSLEVSIWDFLSSIKLILPFPWPAGGGGGGRNWKYFYNNSWLSQEEGGSRVFRCHCYQLIDCRRDVIKLLFYFKIFIFSEDLSYFIWQMTLKWSNIKEPDHRQELAILQLKYFKHFPRNIPLEYSQCEVGTVNRRLTSGGGNWCFLVSVEVLTGGGGEGIIWRKDSS